MSEASGATSMTATFSRAMSRQVSQSKNEAALNAIGLRVGRYEADLQIKGNTVAVNY